MLPLLVPAQRFPHVEGVFARFSPGRVVAVVVDYAAEDAVSVFPDMLSVRDRRQGVVADGE